MITMQQDTQHELGKEKLDIKTSIKESYRKIHFREYGKEGQIILRNLKIGFQEDIWSNKRQVANNRQSCN